MRSAGHDNEWKNGLLVENGNIEQLAKQICYLIENENIRIEMGRQAKIRAKDFTMEVIRDNGKVYLKN